MFEQNYEEACRNADSKLLATYNQLCESILVADCTDTLKSMAREFLTAIKNERSSRVPVNSVPALMMARLNH